MTQTKQVVLTRYLYNKDAVIPSLEMAIIAGEYDKSLFWAYELYYSGFQEETLDILLQIFENMFSKNHPRLGLYIKKKIKENPNAPNLIATIIKNLTLKNSDTKESVNGKFVNVKEHHIDVYNTIEPTTVRNWQFLPMICKCPVFSKKHSQLQTTKLLSIFREHWLYHASFSPIWRERISYHHGKIDKKNKVIMFEDEEDFEAFHNRYAYDSDEQSLEVQKKCMGII